MKPVTDAKAGILLGFEHDTQWYLLQEDKSINALSSEVFPGMFLFLCCRVVQGIFVSNLLVLAAACDMQHRLLRLSFRFQQTMNFTLTLCTTLSSLSLIISQAVY